MTQHLTWDQISECLIGDQGSAAHAGECVSCRSEVARFESALMEFRGAVRQWSDQAGSRSALDSQIVSTTFHSRGMYAGNEFKAGMSSLLVNAGVVVVLLILGTAKPVQQKLTEFIPLIAPNLRPIQTKQEIAKGGGGRPQVAEIRPSKAAPRQFVPQTQRVDQPKLSTPATILPSDLPSIGTQSFGNPLADLGLPAGGNGLGTGIGPGKGPGFGPGVGGGTGGGLYRPGNGVSSPVALVRPEPEYSEEARKAKWQGSVTLQLVVDEAGNPKDIQVTKSLGMGLDQKAIEAVMKWRFRPGTKDGKPVRVIATIEVNFRLL